MPSLAAGSRAFVLWGESVGRYLLLLAVELAGDTQAMKAAGWYVYMRRHEDPLEDWPRLTLEGFLAGNLGCSREPLSVPF